MDVAEIKVRFARLTGKQYDLLHELGKGSTLSQIAERQGITVASVARRLRNLRTTFGLEDAGIVHLFKAWQNNLLDRHLGVPKSVMTPFLIDPLSLPQRQSSPRNDDQPLWSWLRLLPG